MTATGIWQPHDAASGPVAITRLRVGGLDVTVSAGEHTAAVRALAVDRADECEADRADGREADRAAPAGVWEVEIVPARPQVVRVAWQVPCVGVTAFWVPDSGEHRSLPPFWRRPRTSSLEKGAPVGALVGADDRSLVTYAVAEVVREVRIRTGVVEETGDFGFWAEHEAGPDRPLRLRLDLSGRHFADTLAGVARWWGREYGTREVPRPARLPAYSTWYAMQQHVDAEGVERQAAAAAELGCEAVIVDDGWHSDDRGRGYAFVGEWEPSRTTFPDMATHVAKVRALGLAYLLWYALPFVGRRTTLWERVQPYTLAFKEHMDAAIVDPRHPHIRDLLAGSLAKAVTQWGADGLKIDFIDQFHVPDAPAPAAGADCESVTEGVRRLLAELGARLPEGALVELRQPYVSPALWPYATMIRASDCPLGLAHNRQRTIDLRLVAGPLAVHADMMMWHRDESPERIAVQLINTLFSVPQISVDLTALDQDRLAVLRFWLDFCRRHVDVLQHGRLRPFRPDLGYPLVSAEGDGTTVTARYGPLPVPVPATGRLLLANADASTAVVLTVPAPRTATATVVDCRGERTGARALRLRPGVHVLEVPVGGLLELT